MTIRRVCSTPKHRTRVQHAHSADVMRMQRARNAHTTRKQRAYSAHAIACLQYTCSTHTTCMQRTSNAHATRIQLKCKQLHRAYNEHTPRITLTCNAHSTQMQRAYQYNANTTNQAPLCNELLYKEKKRPVNQPFFIPLPVPPHSTRRHKTKSREKNVTLPPPPPPPKHPPTAIIYQYPVPGINQVQGFLNP